MKRISIIRNNSIIVVLVLLFLSLIELFSQEQEVRTWEGMFMEDYRTVITIQTAENDKYTGTIWMYAGEEKLQEDELTEVVLGPSTLKFYIPAKETTFNGKLKEKGLELEGEFVFPDGSRHPFAATLSPEVAKSVNLLPQPLTLDKQMLLSDTDNDGMKDILLHSADMEKDLDLLVRTLAETHPSPYAISGQTKFMKLVEKAKASCEEPLTGDQFLYVVSSLLEKVGCSHTCARINIEAWMGNRNSPEFLPIQVVTNGEELICKGMWEYGAGSIEPGARILSINGLSSQAILEALSDIIPSESRRSSTKLNNMNRHFSYWYHLLDPSGDFLLEYESQNNKQAVEVTGIPLPEAEDPFAPPKGNSLVQYGADLGTDAVVLKINSFYIFSMEEYFATLDSIFVSLKSQGISNLVLDLRNNAGGHPIFAAQLFSYLTGKPFTWFERIPEIKEFEPLYGEMQPNGNAFTGKLFVLVNGGSLSTTGHLISLLDYHTDAVFLGQVPGSTRTCNDFSRRVLLEESGIEVSIPAVTFKTAVPYDQEIPDPFIELPIVLNADSVAMEAQIRETLMSLI